MGNMEDTEEEEKGREKIRRRGRDRS